MALTFYYGAGSPYAWRVWLALEHKAIPFERKVLSFSDGDLKSAEFLALNPRGRVPVIVDREDLVLFESAAILEYLEDAYSDYGKRLFPGSLSERALVRRMVCEADNYFAPALNRLLGHVLFTKEAEWKPDRIAAARDAILAEFERWGRERREDYLAGHLSAADFTLYPMVALAFRCEKRKPDLGLREGLPPALDAWMQGVEMLPFFRKTLPAHWN
jgi:glutathione S-transferase